MNIGVVGSGFVGLVTGACLANNRNKVICIDKDKKKIQKLNQKIVPIYEDGLEKLIRSKINRSIFFKDNLQSINSLDLLFITVGTPLKRNKIDLSSVENCIKEVIKFYNKKKKILIIIKSTIPPGTSEYLYQKYFKNYENLTLVNFLSKRDLPRKVPKPVPVFEATS